MGQIRNTFIILGLLFTVIGYINNLEAQDDHSENWRKTLEDLQIEIPDSLPSVGKDPNRPAGIYKKEGVSDWFEWFDSTGHPYSRSIWGTWPNYDESTANPYTSLPDPLTLENGERVSSESDWWKRRRPQIKKDFNNEIFGNVPKKLPSVEWKIVGTKDTTIGNITALVKNLIGRVDNSLYPDISVGIKLTLVTPANVKSYVPVIMHLKFKIPASYEETYYESKKPGWWQKQVLKNGWGYAEYWPESVQADNSAGLTDGIIGLVNKGQFRQSNDWGILRAWAWGASRAFDYLATDWNVNSEKVGIEGISRYGKAALVAMAFDQRFSIAFIGSSGKGGATLYRRNFGETIGHLGSPNEYHWFAGNFLKYASGVFNINDLPVDTHELIALCAPRPVFIGSGNYGDLWVDPKGMFLAGVYANPVYELLDKTGLEADQFPPVGTALMNGYIGFRQHAGGHTAIPNWPYYIKFAKRFF